LNFWHGKEPSNYEYQPSAAKLAKKESKARQILNELSDEIFVPQNEVW